MRSIPGIITGLLAGTWSWFIYRGGWLAYDGIQDALHMDYKVMIASGLLVLVGTLLLVGAVRRDSPFLGLFTGMSYFGFVLILIRSAPFYQADIFLSSILALLIAVLGVEAFARERISKNIKDFLSTSSETSEPEPRE